MQMTDGELKSNFLQINDKLDLITEHQQKYIDAHEISIKENAVNIADNKSKTDNIETTLNNHLDNHEVIKRDRKFSIEMLVLIGVTVIGVIGTWIKMYLPAP